MSTLNCPICKSSNIGEKGGMITHGLMHGSMAAKHTGHPLIAGLGLLTSFASKLFLEEYECKDCGHTFNK